MAQQAADAGAALFRERVGPLVREQCLGCHNTEIRMGGLSLASPSDAAAGGKHGPPIAAGSPADSRIVKILRHEEAIKMPPGRRLDDADIAAVEAWIAAGAAWPEDSAPVAPPKPQHWTFQRPVRPEIPAVGRAERARTPVDAFILERLEREGIAPSDEAPRPTQIRRAYLDLIGLPPSPEQVRSFVDDARPDAWERLIDGLLDSPRYGERWGRRWLDYARYADSDGGSRDEPRQMWRYRDWVIDALNRDMPFDRFVVEQLAGDLLPNPTNEQLIATGFHRNTPLQIEAGTDREQYRVEAIFDRVDTTGTVFLGLSVGCARCHDHKYDPILHKDYYRLFAFFNTADDWGEGRPRYNAAWHNLHQVHAPLLEFAPEQEIRRRDELIAKIIELNRQIGNAEEGTATRTDERAKEIAAEIKELIAQLPRFESAMIMREYPEPRKTHIFLGGDFLAKGPEVTPGTPGALHSFPAKEGANRLDLARWLVDPANPLLARVTVNRIWQEYFGRGIVETENDFGTQSAQPTHRELLDWLAVEFIESGWSQKHIHRLIATSSTYRQSSRSRPDLDEADPLNYLLARQSRLRLDAEIVRDVALTASGLLTGKIGGPSVFPPQPEAAMETSQIKKSWTASTGEDRYRRGMYTFFWRVTPNPSLMVFDAPNSAVACTRRTRSNTPLQALTLLNELAFHEFAQGLAKRLLNEAPEGGESRLRRAFEICMAREPVAVEVERMRALLAAEADDLQTRPEEARDLLAGARLDGADPVEAAQWTALARVLLNADETLTRE